MGKDNLAKNIKSTEHFNHSECKSCQKPKRNPEKLCTMCLEKFIQLLENENFQCLVCDKVFDEKSGIISHIDETHWSESENSQNKNDKKNVESSEVTTMNKNEKHKRILEESLQTLKVKVEKISQKNDKKVESEKTSMNINDKRQKTKDEKVNKQLNNRTDYVIPPEEIKSENIIDVPKPDHNFDATSQDHNTKGSHDILRKRPKPRPKSKQIGKQNSSEYSTSPSHKKSRGFNDNESRISNDFR